MGEAFDWSSFGAFLDAAGYTNWLSTEWRFSTFRQLSEAAHISYVNEASSCVRRQNQLLRSNRWRRLSGQGGERFKIKFLQSDNVTRESCRYRTLALSLRRLMRSS